jgi:hypothetical protein
MEGWLFSAERTPPAESGAAHPKTKTKKTVKILILNFMNFSLL